MPLSNLVGSLFGKKPEVIFPDDPFAMKAAPTANLSIGDVPTERKRREIIVHRDEIIDTHSRIAGYRFSARTLAGSPITVGRSVVEALKAESIATFAQRRIALIPVTVEDWLEYDYKQFVAPHTFFLITAPFQASELYVWLAGLKEMKAKGARIVLQGSNLYTANFEPALMLCDMVFVNYQDYSLEGFERMVKALLEKYTNVKLAADGIFEWPEKRLCASMGIEYFLGGFSTSMDEEDKSEKLNQSRSVLIEMLNLLKKDAELTELTKIAKRDPSVAVHILEMANSPLSGLSHPLASLDQAVMVLGREILYRWISIAMFRAKSNQGQDETLLELSLSRARFLELLALKRRPKIESDELFMVGMLSLLDSLLGIPMQQVVDKLHLPQSVSDVLLHSEGPYGHYLMLAIAVEKDRMDIAAKHAAILDLDAETIEQCNLEGLAWAEEAMRMGS